MIKKMINSRMGITICLTVLLIGSVTLAGCSSADQSETSSISSNSKTDTSSSTLPTATVGSSVASSITEAVSGSSIDDGTIEKVGKKRVDVLVKKLSSSYWTDFRDYAQSQCDSYGWEMEVLCPTTDDSNEEQIQLIEQSLLDPPDAYVICAADSEGIIPAIEEITEAGIPIVAATNSLDYDSDSLITFVGVDYEDIGAKAADQLVKDLNGQGNIIVLEGTTGSASAEEILDGANSVFEENSGINILDSEPANYQRQTALTVTQNLLQKYQDVDAIYASNGEMALGAAEAVRQAGRSDIEISALNCSKELVQAISDGKISFTADDVSWKMGQESIVSLMKYFAGESLPKSQMQDAVIVSKEQNLDSYKERYGVN